jgi:hypothetical protein
LSKSIANVRNQKIISFSSYQIPELDINAISELHAKQCYTRHDHEAKRVNSAAVFKKSMKFKGLDMTKKNDPNCLSQRVMRIAHTKFEESPW